MYDTMMRAFQSNNYLNTRARESSQMSTRRPRSVRGSAKKVYGEKKRKVTKQDVLHGPSRWASPILPQTKVLKFKNKHCHEQVFNGGKPTSH